MNLLPTTTGAIIRKVVPYDVHGQPHLQVFYAPAGAENDMREARIGTDIAYPSIAEGDQVAVHILMNTVTKIEKIA